VLTHHGRSFGLILALLSKYWNPTQSRKRPLPASLLLVPHRDLAYQFRFWIERIASVNSGLRHSMPAHVVVRGQEEPSLHVSQIRKTPPGILIGTPQAILDMLHEDENLLNFWAPSTVVVDEVDYIIDLFPAGASVDKKKRLAAKIKRHPSAGKLLLDQIFVPPIRGGSVVASSPQLVVCSATLQTGLRQQLYQNGWFRKAIDSVVKVRSEILVRETQKWENNVAAPDGIQHCALLFSEDGSIRDVDVEDTADPKWSSGVHADRLGTQIQGGDLPEIPTQLAEGGLSISYYWMFMELIVFGLKSTQ
jgi:superfamily II DNA/RNA helicase